MRPIDKGTCPTDAAGNPKTVTDYKAWRSDLVQRIGEFCVYCNVPLSFNLNVEHVVAKVARTGAAAGSMLSWNNMLLACGPCNWAKSNKPTSKATHYFPDHNNTLIPLKIVVHPNHSDAAVVAVKTTINGAQTIKAQNTIGLLELAAIDRREKVVDLRWKRRLEAMKAVNATFGLYQQVKLSPNFNPLIEAPRVAAVAASVGFFGLWFDTFYNEAEVMSALIDPLHLPGTAQNCFDPANGYQFLPRNPGQADPI